VLAENVIRGSSLSGHIRQKIQRYRELGRLGILLDQIPHVTGGSMQGLTLGGRYLLDRLIGRGGMGEVWGGTDLRLRRAVAVKVLARELAADQNAVTRFRREAETAAALQHPGIAVVFDVDVHVDATGQTLFLVMELLDGRDLRTVLDGAPAGLPIAQAVSFGTQIAEALAALPGPRPSLPSCGRAAHQRLPGRWLSRTISRPPGAAAWAWSSALRALRRWPSPQRPLLCCTAPGVRQRPRRGAEVLRHQ
jgi:serine/threonine protein kinase